MSEATDATWRALARAWLLGVLALRLCTFLDYGLTWDEEFEKRNAVLTVRWYTSGFRDAAFLQDDRHLYGSFFNVMVWLAARVSLLGYYETGHLLTTLFGFLATLMTYRLGADLGGPRAGFFSAVALTLTPVFFGHSFNNPKDGPFAALFLTALALALRAYRSTAPPSSLRLLGVGAAIGLAAGVRIVGLSLLLVVAALAIWRAAGGSHGKETRSGWAAAGPLAIVTLGAVAATLPWWPYLQRAPVEGTLNLFHNVTQFEWNRTVLFEGRQVAAHALPRRYLPVWFLVSLPDFYFVAAVMGAGLAHRGESPRPASRSFEVLLVLSTALVPIGAAIVLRPVLYDGLRQVLFVLPPLAVLAGLGLDAIARQPPRWPKRLALALAGGSLALTTGEMWMLHPYQSVYFNRTFGGGLPRASQRFETDYWGSSYKEAVEWLIANHRPVGPERLKVANVSNMFLTAYYLQRPEAQARFEAVRRPGKADIVLATTRWNLHRAWPGRILHTVQREGVALCYVIARRPPQPSSR